MYGSFSSLVLPARSSVADALLRDGSTPLTADWDAGAFEIRAQTFESDVATGTAPLTIASTTLVTNLNADLLDGQHASAFLAGTDLDALELKASVRAATTANITLSGLQTVDGVSLADGDRVLVKDQTTASENGIYVVDDYGAWARADDMAAGSDASACFTHVREGDANAGTKWLCVNEVVSGVVGTGDLVFDDRAILEDGAVGSPSLTFVGDRTTGFYHNSGIILLASSGSAFAAFSSLGLTWGTGSVGQAHIAEGADESYVAAGVIAFSDEFSNGSSGASKVIAWSRGNGQSLTLDANTTLTFSVGGTGTYTGSYLTLKLIQDGTGSRTVTWPSSVKWAGGTAPTLSTAAGAVDIIHLYHDGTDYYGHAILNVS